MTVTPINPFEVAPDRETEFLKGWKHTAEVFAAKPGYLETDGPGTTSGKRKVLDDHVSKRLLVTSFRFNEMSVHVLGPDAAIAAGQYAWDASYAGRPIPGTFRYLRVYARTGGGWQVRAGQVTPVMLRAQHG